MAESITKSRTRSFLYVKSGTYGNPTNPATFASYNANVKRTHSESFSGVKNPAWRDQIRLVVSATTPASGDITSMQFRYGSGSATYRAGALPGNDYARFWTCARYLPDTFGFTSSLSQPSLGESADNLAIARMNEQLISFETSAPSGEDLGEISQTARLLRAPLKDLRGLILGSLEGHIHGLKRPNRSSIIKGLGATALEYQWGIRPLTKSIANAVVGLQGRDYLSAYFPFKASAKVEKSNIASITDDLGPLIVDLFGERRVTERIRYKGIWAVRTDVDRRSVNDVLGLRWRDVVPTAWNLIPYSQLLDYCTNLGKIAEQYSVPYSGVRWCNRTYRREELHSFFGQGLRIPVDANNWVGSLSPVPYAVRKYTTFNRTNQVGQPMLRFEIDFKLSPERLFNVAALISTRMPILRELTQRAERKYPGIAGEFAQEAKRRNMRVPYPFHR